MKILLVSSYLGRRQTPVFPLGLACLASVLEDHDVAVVDPMLAPDPMGAVREAARKMVPDVIGLSLRNIDPARSYDRFDYLEGLEMTLRAARDGAPRATTVVGGSGYSLFPEVVLKRVAAIDVGVYLDGEASFPELLQNLGHPESVRGLYVRRDGGIVFTGDRAAVDLDAMPLPDRDCVDLSAYMGRSEIQIGVETHRGCAMHCIYCTYPQLSGERLRYRRSERVLEDIENIRRRGGRRFFFTDPCFNNPLDPAVEMCRALVDARKDMTWSAYFSEKTTTPESVRLYRDAGCACFIYGADAGHDSVLNRLGKGITRKDIEVAYRTVRKEAPKVPLKTAFMLNAPGETFGTLMATLGIVIKGFLTGAYEPSFSCIRIYPGTEIHRIAIAEGRVDPDDDLLKPTYYNPGPLKVVCWIVDRVSRFALAVLRLFRATPH